MILKAQLREAIDGLNLADKAVCIHASMHSFGDWVEQGAEGLLQCFLEKGCTVMTPAFSYNFLASPVMPYMPAQNGAGDYGWYRAHALIPGVFSTDSKEISTEDMGVFARTLLRHPHAVRGNHPLNSFAAVGKYAHELIDGQNWQQVYAPFDSLCHLDGWVLMLGTDLKSATILHHGEQQAGRMPFVRWAKDVNEQVMPAAVGSCSEGFEQFTPVLQHLERRMTVGKSLWRLYPAKEMVMTAASAIQKSPMITHCGREACKRCHDAVLGGPVLDAAFWT